MSMSMSLTDRREETRIPLRIPLKFRPVTTPPSGEQIAQTIDISRRGLRFATGTPLAVGSEVEIFIKTPSEISGNAPAEARCIARVMHIELGKKPGEIEVGLRVDRYETVGAKEQRWTS